MVRARRRRTLKHREGEGEGAEHHTHHPPPAHLLAQVVYTVKKRLSFFPSSDGMSLTKLSLDGNTLIIPSQARETLVSDIPAGDGKNDNLFLQCI
jgi:hypothetical protein